MGSARGRMEGGGRAWELSTTSRRYYWSNLGIGVFTMLFGAFLIGYVATRLITRVPIPASPTLPTVLSVAGVCAVLFGVPLAIPFPRELLLTPKGVVFRSGSRVAKAISWADPELSLTFVDFRATRAAMLRPEAVFGLVFARLGPWWRPGFPVEVEAFDAVVDAARRNGCKAYIVGAGLLVQERKIIRIMHDPERTRSPSGA